jgi:retron-type reverse transcriptase
MKRKGNLYETLTSWKNLLVAEKKARKGKRYRKDVAEFHWNHEAELLSIQHDLIAGIYEPGNYRTFEICDPKRRVISAAPYRDRVVHHAICNLIEPILDHSFIHDSYACRKGKGQVAAVRRAYNYMKNFRFVAKTDIRRYFASIDHEILLSKLQCRFKDPKVIHVVDRIIRKPFPRQQRPEFFLGDDLLSHSERTCGLPLGNQTSQLFGNFYLDQIDHRMKEIHRIPGMVRYMDDIVLFADSKAQLWDALDQISFMLGVHRLRLHRKKTTVTTTVDGVRFLGFHVRSSGIRLRSEFLVRTRKRFQCYQ